MREAVAQEGVLALYKELKSEKTEKTNFMERARRVLRPTRTHMLRRYSPSSQVYNPEVVVDITGGIALRKFSTESLKDIRNMTTPWFTFYKPLYKKIDKGLKEKYREWCVENEGLLDAFINDSDYHLALAKDNFFYNMYGYSGMTFGLKDGELLTVVEDPFDLYIVKSNQKVVGCMWIREYKMDDMKREFDWVDPDFKDDDDGEVGDKPLTRYRVLHVTLPNNSSYIKDPIRTNFKFVQLFVLVDRRAHSNIEALKNTATYENMEGVEIGYRRHFLELPTVIPVDSVGPKDTYGDGEGEWILQAASNCNKFKKNILSSSTIKARPPLQAPQEFHMGQSYVEPGRVYPRDPTRPGGMEDIKFIEFKDKLGEQSAILQDEREQIYDALPTTTSPMKKQRQSEFEIQKQELDRMTTQFSYKITYLKKGVAEHLKRMYYIARDAGVLTDLPDGLDWEDVEPSIANLIELEKQKLLAQGHVVVASMAQPYLSNYPQGWDNFKKDEILRDIAQSLGKGSTLNSIETRNRIREERRKMEQGMQNQQNALTEAHIKSLQSRAGKDSSQQSKMAAETRQITNEGG